MMTKMRTMIPTIMVIVIVAFVATIFFAWGMDFSGARGSKQPIVAKVGNQVIPIDIFEREVGAERERQTEMAGGDLPQYQSRMLPRQVLETNISRILYREIFKQMKLAGSGEEVFQYIRNNPPQSIVESPMFQTDSVFDTTKFENWLNDPANLDVEGMRAFENQIRNFIVPMDQLKNLVEAANFVTRAEVQREYRQELQRSVFSYAMVNARSIPLDANAITPAMIDAYYKAHPDSFKTGDQAEIYVAKIAKTPTAQDDQEYQSELQDMKKRIESKETTFEEEAKISSDDKATAASGGELGLISKGSMDPEFEKVAFSLDTGVISDPVKTSLGYHLIQVQKKEGGKIQVRHILRKIRASAETLDSLEQKADSVRDAMASTGFLKVARGDASLQLDSLGPLPRDAMLNTIGAVQGLTHFAFTAAEGSITEKPLESEDGFYIASVKKRYKKGLMPATTAKNKIVIALRDSLQVARAGDRLKSLLANDAGKTPLAQLSKIDSAVTSGTTDTVTRMQYVPGFGKGNPAVTAAFVLPAGKKSEVINANGMVAVVEPVWRAPLDSIQWDSPTTSMIMQQISEQSKQLTFYDWYLDYKKSMKIEDNLGRYYPD
jgi:hypothetical protein